MGLSTDAYFWFGMTSSGEEEDTLPESVLLQLGFDPDNMDDDDEPTEVLRERLKSLGCELVQHCSYDYPVYALAIEGTVSWAWRGDSVKVESVEALAEWVPRLMKAAEEVGWPVGEVGWFLASNMG